MPTGILRLTTFRIQKVVKTSNNIFFENRIFSKRLYICLFYVFVFWAPSRVIDNWRGGGGGATESTPRDHTSSPTRGVLRTLTRGAQGLKTPGIIYFTDPG